MITDTQRLDFIVGNYENQGYYRVMSNPTGSEWVVWDQSNGLELIGRADTMRDAIDQAMIDKGVMNV